MTTFAPFFTDKYVTPWGKAINFDDRGCDGVRNFFLQHARMLLEDHRVDGLRLDAVHAIKDFSANHFMRQLTDLCADISKRTGRCKVLIGESDLNDPRYIDPISKGGYGLHGQWIDEFHHSLRAYITGERHGYLEDFGTLDHLARAFTHTYVYDGGYSKHRDRKFGGTALCNNFDQFIVFSQNHDQVGNRAEGDRLTQALSQEQLKLVAATVLLSPYVPMLFMGEEYGEKNPFQFFVRFGDPELVEGVREGRKREFAAFVKDGHIPDPQSEETFLRSNLSWRCGSGPGAELLAFYRHLIHFRKHRLAMQGRTRDSLILHRCENGLLCFERVTRSDAVLVFLLFGTVSISIPNYFGSTLQKVIDSTCPIPEGRAKCQMSVDAGSPIQLPAHSCLVFAKA